MIWKLQHDDLLTVCKEYQLNYELARVVVPSQLMGKFTGNPLPQWPRSFDSNRAGISRDILKYYVETEPLETVLWYYKEFMILTDEIVQRLENITSRALVPELNLSYGKLMSLLMETQGTAPTLYEHLLRVAEQRMKDYNMNIESPVAVLGDASASMQVAINTSSIITSLVCSLADADLHLFKNVDIPCKDPPRTVSEAVAYAKTVGASSSTSPAASLYWYYQNKKAIKTFVIVTDEEENTGYDGSTRWYGASVNETMFAALYDKYCTEIGPARLVFVSFTNPTCDGQMIQALKRRIGEKKVAEFVSVYKFDIDNPDLNKLDYMLEKLAQPDEGTSEKLTKPAKDASKKKGWFSGHPWW